MGLLRKKSDCQLIQGTPAVTVCFFLLAPLPQAIKIFGSGGLLWTKVWLVIFFIAWSVEVITRFVSALPRSFPVEAVDVSLQSSSRHQRYLSRVIYQVAFATQASTWLWIVILLCKIISTIFGLHRRHVYIFIWSLDSDWYHGPCLDCVSVKTARQHTQVR